jgi:hypothetical protein
MSDKPKRTNLLLPVFVIKIGKFLFGYKALRLYDRVRVVKNLLFRWTLFFYTPVFIWVLINTSKLLWAENKEIINVMPCFVNLIPVPFFKPVVHSPLIFVLCVLLDLAWVMIGIVVLNVMTDKMVSLERIEEKWRRACLHVGLTCQTNLEPEKDVKEFPSVVSVNPRTFIVTAKGFTPEKIQERRAELSADMNLFFGDIGYLKKRDGSCHANLIEIKYSWSDLPAMISLRSVPIASKGELIFGLGMDGFVKLSLEEMVHLGVSGETGSGKSVFLRQLITQLMVTDPELIVIGIDFKGGVEFSFFSQLGNFVCVDDFEKTDKVLEIVLNEYLRRLTIVRENSCDSVYDLRNRGFYLSPILVLVDEGAEFFGDKKQSKVYELVSKIARLGRFAGIHLVISTQRADVEAIPQQIRSMLVTRVIFKVSQKEDSIMFIGTAEATKLRKLPGRFYLKDSEGRLKELQSPYVSKAEVKEILSGLKLDKNNGLMKLLKSAIYENRVPSPGFTACGETVCDSNFMQS